MKMQTMLPEHFKNLEEIITLRVAESNITDVTLDTAWHFAETIYNNRSGGIYVDDLQRPSHCLCMVHYIDPMRLKTVAVISLIYSKPEARSTESWRVMIDMAKTYARLVNADIIHGSSWVFRGSKDTSSLWESCDFELQEKKFTLTLQ
jgi:hypothetical protein